MRRIGARLSLAVLVLFAVGSVAADAADKSSESWDAVYIAGSKVGYIRTRVNPVQDRGRPFLNVLVDFNLSFKRGKDPINVEVQYGTIETADGQILKLDTRSRMSQQDLRVHGNVVDNKMTLKIENGDQGQEKVIPWGPEILGPYGPELSFARKPPTAGEVRKVKMFVPDYNIIAEATLTARDVEPVALGGNTVRDLRRVDQEVVNEAGKKMPEMNQTFWVDPGGQVLKSYTDSFGGTTTYRTTREFATRNIPGAQRFDLLTGTVVKLDRQVNNPESTRDVIYKLTMPDANPVDLFPADRRQSIKPGDDAKTATLEVKTAGPDDGQPGPEAVEAEFLRSNPLVTSSDPRVISLARTATAGLSDPWAKAQAINKWVHKNMKNKNFETSFAAADEVARTLSGDCTEHGVLTAAMCRAEGIPAKVVVGLVYADQLGGFGFHMWDEVYINRRWVAIDSAFDQTTLDAVHIKLSDTSLDGVSPFETFTSVVRVANKLKIEAVEIR